MKKKEIITIITTANNTFSLILIYLTTLSSTHCLKDSYLLRSMHHLLLFIFVLIYFLCYFSTFLIKTFRFMSNHTNFTIISLTSLPTIFNASRITVFRKAFSVIPSFAASNNSFKNSSNLSLSLRI